LQKKSRSEDLRYETTVRLPAPSGVEGTPDTTDDFVKRFSAVSASSVLIVVFSKRSDYIDG
jgi:hypothetical protein